MKNTLKIWGLLFAVSLISFILMTGIFAADFSEDALLYGTCEEGGTVHWEILSNDEGKYTFNIFGEGVFKNLTSEGNPIGYSNPEACAWNEYRLDITKVIIGDGIVQLAYGSFMHHKSIHTIEFGSSLTRLEATAMEGCNRLRTIYRRGNTPEIGTFDLRGITYFGAYLFDGCEDVEKIIFPTEGSYRLNTEFLKNNYSLKELYIPAACSYIGALAFSYCNALKNVYIEGDTALTTEFSDRYNYNIHSFEGCPDGLTISAKTGSNAHNYALSHSSYVLYEGTEKETTRSINYMKPCTVSVYDGDENITNIDVVKGFHIDNKIENNGLYVFFEDEARTTLVTDVTIMSDMKIYGAKLFDFVGFMVRTADYNGLRAIYNYNSTALASLSAYSVKEMGVLGAKYYGVDPVLDLDFYHASKNIIWENGEIVGKLVEAPRKGIYTFANTAVGYEDESGEPVETRVASEILTRAYVIIQNESTGEEIVFYSSQNKKDLTTACEATIEAGAGILNAEQTAFIEGLMALGADPDYIYTKEEALEHLTNVYNDPKHIMSGQHISYSPSIVKDILNETYANTKELPAVLSYDVAVGYRGYMSSPDKNAFQAELADDFAEYARQGGLISFCAHMTNPSYEHGNYTGDAYRGSLTLEQWNQLLLLEGNTADNAIYTSFMTELSAIADFIELLEERGVPIFWRPYHETNGAWFWFCGASIPKKINHVVIIPGFIEYDREVDVSADYFKKLWEMTYNYLENERGLTNLLWMYSPNIAGDGSTSGTLDVMKYYPGDDYVDVMGLDWYNNSDTAAGATPTLLESGYQTIWSRLAGKYTGSSKFPTTTKQMPVVYGEYGPGDDLRNADPALSYNGEDALDLITKVNESGRNMGWIVFWASWDGAPISLYAMDKADVFMASDLVYDLAESKEALLGMHYSE